MRTIRIKLYKFSELSKDAQQKAIEHLADINTDYDWYKYMYEDAEQAGINITGFDLDYGTIKGEFITSAGEVVEYILDNHGKNCNTYKTALSFKHEFQNTSDEVNEDELDAKEDEFLKTYTS